MCRVCWSAVRTACSVRGYARAAVCGRAIGWCAAGHGGRHRHTDHCRVLPSAESKPLEGAVEAGTFFLNQFNQCSKWSSSLFGVWVSFVVAHTTAADHLRNGRRSHHRGARSARPRDRDPDVPGEHQGRQEVCPGASPDAPLPPHPSPITLSGAKLHPEQQSSTGGSSSWRGQTRTIITVTSQTFAMPTGWYRRRGGSRRRTS